MDLPANTPPAPIFEELCRAAEIHRVPLRLLIGLAWVESRFNPHAGPSRAGAIGIMQLIPSTARALGVTNPWNVAQSVHGAARFLAKMHGVYGTWEQALACYCWGPGNVRARPDAASWPAQVGAYVRAVNRAGHACPIPYTGQVWAMDLGAAAHG